jgi:hypothetical protein
MNKPHIRESITRKNLRYLRKFITLYRQEYGHFPITWNKEALCKENTSSILFNYIEVIDPILKIHLPSKTKHLPTTNIKIVSTKPGQKIQPHQITDEGGWIYSSDSGDIRINCSHLDTAGIPYSDW